MQELPDFHTNVKLKGFINHVSMFVIFLNDFVFFFIFICRNIMLHRAFAVISQLSNSKQFLNNLLFDHEITVFHLLQQINEKRTLFDLIFYAHKTCVTHNLLKITMICKMLQILGSCNHLSLQ